MRPSDFLSGTQPQFEVDSPEQRYTKGVKAMRGIVQEQGAVMSLALENNEALFNRNKVLAKENIELRSTIDGLRLTVAKLEAENAILGTPDRRERAYLAHELEGARALIENLTEALKAHMIPELDTDGRKARLEALMKQREEMQLRVIEEPDAPADMVAAAEAAAAEAVADTVRGAGGETGA